VARAARCVVAGLPHFIVQRGHNGAPIVRDDADRAAWLATLRECAAAQRVGVQAWALLDEGFELLATPPTPTALGRMLQALGRRYVAAFNRRHGRTGALWNGRFQAAPVEPGPWVLEAMRSIELAGRRADAPGWTSEAHHAGKEHDARLADPPAYWAIGNTPFERHAAWRHWLDAGVPAPIADALRAAASRGRPAGGRAFVAALEQQLARPLTARPRGRPPGRSASR
jgi:putative transposase